MTSLSTRCIVKSEMFLEVLVKFLDLLFLIAAYWLKPNLERAPKLNKFSLFFCDEELFMCKGSTGYCLHLLHITFQLLISYSTMCADLCNILCSPLFLVGLIPDPTWQILLVVLFLHSFFRCYRPGVIRRNVFGSFFRCMSFFVSQCYLPQIRRSFLILIILKVFWP